MARLLRLLPLVLLLAAGACATQDAEDVSDAAQDPFELAEVDEPPRLRNGKVFGAVLARLYPRDQLDAGAGGIVLVRFRIDEKGVPHDAVVIGSTNPAFDKVTRTAVVLLRFHPARVDGHPVAVWAEQPVEWQPDASR